jgi:hypothetical protein
MDNKAADKCPLCAGDNDCAIAAGRAAQTCWCMTVDIPAALLETLPEDERGVRCLCSKCVSDRRTEN